MKKPIRIFVWTVSSLLLLPVAAYLIWLTGNTKDDEWSLAATALMSVHREGSATLQGNAYNAFIGLESPEDIEPAYWGEAWVAEAKQVNAGIAQPDDLPGTNLRKRTIAENQPLPCREALGCLARVAADTKAVETVLADERIILERLDSLVNLPFQEVGLGQVSPTSLLAPYPGWAFVLARHRFALRVAQGEHQQALQHWAQETAFLTRIMAGSDSAITYLTASSSLRGYHHLMAQYLSLHPEAARAHDVQIRAALAHPSPQALSLKKVLTHEVQYIFSILMRVGNSGAEGLLFTFSDTDEFQALSSAKRVLNDLSVPFFKPIATCNKVASWFEAWGDADSRKRTDYRAHLLKLRTDHRERSSYWTWLSYRNPVGKVLEQTLFENAHLTRIFFTRDNVVADRLLLQHALAVISGNVSFNPVPSALYQADLLHPFTGQPPIWDGASGELRFEQPDDLELSSRDLSLSVRFPSVQ